MFDAIAAVQSMGKPSRVRNRCDLASHFIEVVDAKSNVATEVHIVYEGMCQKRLVTYRAVIYKIAVDAVIDKTTMKDLLSCNQNKEARLIECLVLCRDHFQHLWH